MVQLADARRVRRPAPVPCPAGLRRGQRSTSRTRRASQALVVCCRAFSYQGCGALTFRGMSNSVFSFHRWSTPAESAGLPPALSPPFIR
ncbi:hypothetical protein CSUI_008848 [Cystoisospora suis]|uniref:Uncharacterized protein n=1 Tax=Cystoisospora suis TaxID=483139 RepID=A0A2C6K716_9APIC|nr:hypothetical protein CSUI_008848 [Cystoisospora suis]